LKAVGLGPVRAGGIREGRAEYVWLTELTASVQTHPLRICPAGLSRGAGRQMARAYSQPQNPCMRCRTWLTLVAEAAYDDPALPLEKAPLTRGFLMAPGLRLFADAMACEIRARSSTQPFGRRTRRFDSVRPDTQRRPGFVLSRQDPARQAALSAARPANVAESLD